MSVSLESLEQIKTEYLKYQDRLHLFDKCRFKIIERELKAIELLKKHFDIDISDYGIINISDEVCSPVFISEKKSSSSACEFFKKEEIDILRHVFEYQSKEEKTR